MQFYSNPTRAADPNALPNAEVFYVDEQQAKLGAASDGELPDQPGYYYWFCFPGCLPDGPATGPYGDALEAIEACQLDEHDSIE